MTLGPGSFSCSFKKVPNIDCLARLKHPQNGYIIDIHQIYSHNNTFINDTHLCFLFEHLGNYQKKTSPNNKGEAFLYKNPTKGGGLSR